MFSLVKLRIKFVHPNIAEILLKLVLNTNQSINPTFVLTIQIVILYLDLDVCISPCLYIFQEHL